jgi:hypothetical protein
LVPAFEPAPLNIEQAVLENLRLLPTDRQNDVLVFIHSLLPFDPEAAIKAAILKQVIPPLQKIQNFHDGLPSAVYASRFLRSIQALAQEFPDSAYGQVLQALDQSLSPGQQWGCYTVEYYQTVVQLLSELVDRPQISASDVQSAVSTIEQISQTMTQSGIVNCWEVEE